MERYLGYILNIVAGASGAEAAATGVRRQRRSVTDEREVSSLPGYRGMGPVRVGNQAYQQVQHDVYGSAILAATHVFFDQRLVRHAATSRCFAGSSRSASAPRRLFDQPDAGLWELRGAARVHTFSSVMCWAGCDRLARIAAHLGLADRAAYWRDRRRAASTTSSRERAGMPPTRQLRRHDGRRDARREPAAPATSWGSSPADDPRFAGDGAKRSSASCSRGDFVFRYVEADDFGVPENAFLVCTFWYINALAAIGRRDEARGLFESVLACRNRHGLLAEHIDPRTREQWGNFVQTYSMVGLIDVGHPAVRPVGPGVLVGTPPHHGIFTIGATEGTPLPSRINSM